MTKNQTKPAVSVLITWDVDPDAWVPVETRLYALDMALNVCEEQNIKATFFFTADLAETYQSMFGPMQRYGHEVGCHGLTHGIEENYDQMPEEMQRKYITEATQKLNTLIDIPVSSFRSPRVKTSATTLAILAEQGYTSDSSVCPQRMDIVSSNLINVGWLTAPRRPYRPHAQSAFKAGDMPIWEVPVSALILPFISSTFEVFGLRMMKALFRILYLEAKKTGKPIVYLAHPTEFQGSGKKKIAWRQFIGLQYLQPKYIKAHGVRMRSLLFRFRGKVLANYTRELFAYMAQFPDVQFMTVNEYTQTFLAQETHDR